MPASLHRLAASRSDSGTRLTETELSLGTPHYMSPEQAMGTRDHRQSDVYALGCVVYEMRSGATLVANRARALLPRHRSPPNAVQVLATPTFATGGRASLFDASNFVITGFHQSYEVTPDGRAFYFISPRRATNSGAPQIVWIDHWFRDLAVRRDR